MDVADVTRELQRQLRQFGPFHPQTLRSRFLLATLLEEQGEDVTPMLEENLGVAERVLGPAHPQSASYREALARNLLAAGRGEEAVALRRRTHELTAATGATDETLESGERLALTLRDLGRDAESADVLAPLLDRAARDLGPASERAIALRNLLAIAVERSGDDRRARALFQENLERMRGADVSVTLRAHVLANLADTESTAGRDQRALPLWEEALDIRRDADPADPQIPELLGNIGCAQIRLDRRVEGIATLREAAAAAESLPADNPARAWVLAQLGMALRDTALSESVAVLERAVAEAEANGSGEGVEAGYWRNHLAAGLERMNRLPEALERYRRNVEVFEARDGEGSPAALDYRAALAGALLAEDPDAALGLLRRNEELARAADPAGDDARFARERLVSALLQTDHGAEAVTLLEAERDAAEQVSLTSEATIAARSRLAAVYWTVGRHGDAQSLWRSILADRERALGREAPEAIDRRATVAAASGAADNPADQAAVLAVQAEAMERTLGPLSARTLGVRGRWAAALLRAGRAGEAVAVLEPQVAGLTRAYGPDDARTLRARAVLAVARGRVGAPAVPPTPPAPPAETPPSGTSGQPSGASAASRPTPSAETVEQVAADVERILGPHALGVALREARASQLLAAGEAARAVEVLTDAVAVAEDVCGPQAPETLRSALALGQAADAAGDTEAARSAYQRLLTDGVSAGVDAAWIGHARVRLRQLGARLPEAREVVRDDSNIVSARRALAAARRDFGETSPEARRALTELGDALRWQGSNVEAEDQFADLYRLEVEASGENSVEALAASNRRAMALEAYDPDAALELYVDNLARAEEHLGLDHELTQVLRNNLADTYETLRQADRALWHFGRNVASYARTQGDGARATIEGRRRVAWLTMMTERPHTALPMARRALADAEGHLTPGSETTLDCRNLVAMVCESLGDPEEAQALYEANLVEGEQALGDEHPALLPFRNNLARLYLELERPDEALTLLRKSWDAACRELPTGDFRRGDVLRIYGEALLAVGQAGDAIALLDAHREDWTNEGLRRLWARAHKAAGSLTPVIDDLQRAVGDQAAVTPAARDLVALLEVAERDDELAELRTRLRLLAPAEDGDSGEIPRALAEAATIAAEGRHQEAAGLVGAALRRQVDGLAASQLDAIMLCSAASAYYVRAGLRDELTALFEELIDQLLPRVGWVPAVGFMWSEVVAQHSRAGRWDAWARRLMEGVAVVLDSGAPVDRVRIRLLHADALRRCRALPESLAVAEAAVEDAREADDPELLAFAEQFLRRLRRTAARR